MLLNDLLNAFLVHHSQRCDQPSRTAFYKLWRFPSACCTRANRSESMWNCPGLCQSSVWVYAFRRCRAYHKSRRDRAKCGNFKHGFRRSPMFTVISCHLVNTSFHHLGNDTHLFNRVNSIACFQSTHTKTSSNEASLTWRISHASISWKTLYVGGFKSNMVSATFCIFRLMFPGT